MKKIRNKIKMNIFISVLLLFLGAALIVFFSYYFVCGPAEQVAEYAEIIDSSVLFNYLPVLILAFIFSLFFGNVFYGLSITTLIVDIFAFADHYMIEYRGEPLSYGDLFSLKEGLTAVNHFAIEIDVLPLILIIAAAMILFLLGIFTKNCALKFPFRLIFSVLGVVLLVFVCRYLYSSDFPQYQEIKNNKALTWQFNRNIKCQMVGPVFFFIDSYHDYHVNKPDGYHKSTFVKAEKNSVTADIPPEQILPDVIFVTCECFSDLADIDYFNYYSYDNPITEFHRLCNDGNSLSGYIYTPVYGGGTCNTELEVLRSLFIQYSSWNMANTVYGKKDSIVTRFAEYGYQTTYIHPGDDWFYNRRNIMKSIGFEETFFNDDFEDPEYLHEMISDNSVADFIIKKYEEQQNDGNPVFIDAMTIAGHFPFYWEEGLKFVPLNGSLDSESHAEISMYLQRMSETNQMMKTLADYYSDIEKPVILVFYGDHLPALGNNCSLYSEIGYPLYDDSNDELSRKYKIPYVIWGNDAASSYFEAYDPEGTSSDFSAPFLGVTVLDFLGLAEGYPYYDFLLTLKKQLPVIHTGFCINGEGEELKDIPSENQEKIKTLKQWNYYFLKDN